MGFHWQNNSTILAFCGGLLVGAVSSSRLALFGKVTGISGILKGASVLNFDSSRERLNKILFITGLGFIPLDLNIL